MKKIIVMVLAVLMCVSYADARGSSSSSRSSGSRSYSSKSSTSSKSYNSSSRSATPSKSVRTPSITPRSTPAPLTMPKYNSSSSKITPKYTPAPIKTSSRSWFNKSTPSHSTSRMVPNYHRSYSYDRPSYTTHHSSGFGMTDYLMLYMIFGNHNNNSTKSYVNNAYPVAPTLVTTRSNVVTTVPAYLCNTQYLGTVEADERVNGTYTVSDETARKVEQSKNSVMLFNVGMLVLIVLAVFGVIGWIVYIKTKG
jgi:hypothetical protein